MDVKNRTGRGRYALLGILVVTVLIVGIFEIFWLVRNGNTPQIYRDIVLEELGAEFANKSTERTLYWIGILLGLVIITICLIFGRKRKRQIPKPFLGVGGGTQNLIVAAISILLAGSYIFYGYFNPVVVLAEVVIVCSFIFFKGKAVEGVTCYFVLLYAITAVYRFLVLIGCEEILNQAAASILALVITIIFLASGNKIVRAILVMQIPIPLLLLIYLVNGYEYQEQIITLQPERAVYIAIIGCIVVLIAMELWNVKKKWEEDSVCNCISAGSSIAIMAFQRFSGAGYIMLNDMHHPAENTIAYNEIANLGRKAFSEYVPVSGLYSYVQGFFLEVFGKGNYTAYSITNNIFYLAVIIVLVAALRLHLKPVLVFFCAIFICVPDYSRVALIMPFMFILLSKKLVEKPDLWFAVWVLFSWCYGLYYPAYGVAVVVSLLPLGLYQLKYCLDGIKRAGKGRRILCAGMYICLLLGIIASMPLLVGTLKHVIAMGDGMLYVDGVTVFGQALPNDFLKCLNYDNVLYTVRLMAGYIIRFSGPMVTIWIAFCSVLHVFRHREGRTWRNIWFTLERKELQALAAFIFPFVCFYFSLYRMGAANLFNRAVYIMDYSLIVVAVLVYEFGKSNYDKYILVLSAIFVCTLGNSIGINGLAGKYFKDYVVSEEYVFTDVREDIPRLGKGFVQQDLMDGIESAAARYRTMDHGRNYYALFANGEHGMAYDAMLNIKGTAMLETLVVRGYSIALDTAEKLILSDTVVGNQISPVDHYYLYKWLCTGGKYIWSSTDQLFYPVRDEGAEEIRQANSLAIAAVPSYDVGRYAASLGNSLDSLQDVLTGQELYFYNLMYGDDSISVDFNDILDGNAVDYVYFDLDMDRENYTSFLFGEDGSRTARNELEDALMKHEFNSGTYVVVEWQDDKGETRYIKAMAENGKVLMPVGAGVGWLNNNHSHLSIWLEKDGVRLAPPEINEIGLYKVRDLAIDS